MMTGEIKYNNVQSYSGTSAPWTGQIIVTEEEPAGKPDFNLHNLTLNFFLKKPPYLCVLCCTWFLISDQQRASFLADHSSYR